MQTRVLHCPQCGDVLIQLTEDKPSTYFYCATDRVFIAAMYTQGEKNASWYLTITDEAMQKMMNAQQGSYARRKGGA
jgi:hypothetical protein